MYYKESINKHQNNPHRATFRRLLLLHAMWVPYFLRRVTNGGSWSTRYFYGRAAKRSAMWMIVPDQKSGSTTFDDRKWLTNERIRKKKENKRFQSWYDVDQESPGRLNCIVSQETCRQKLIVTYNKRFCHQCKPPLLHLYAGHAQEAFYLITFFKNIETEIWTMFGIFYA